MKREFLTTTVSQPSVCWRGPLKLKVEFHKAAKHAGASQEAAVQATKAAMKAKRGFYSHAGAHGQSGYQPFSLVQELYQRRSALL